MAFCNAYKKPKRCYGSKREARRSRPPSSSVHVFDCVACGHYHLGSSRFEPCKKLIPGKSFLKWMSGKQAKKWRSLNAVFGTRLINCECCGTYHILRDADAEHVKKLRKQRYEEAWPTRPRDPMETFLEVFENWIEENVG